MSAEAIKILEAAMLLDEQERANIAEKLFESLDDEAEIELHEEWEAEIARRVADSDSGKTKLIPWPEARRQIIEGISGEADA